MAKRRARCTVEFRKDSAVLFDKHGHSINVMNFPKGHKMSAKARAAARRRLMKGCAELSRGR